MRTHLYLLTAACLSTSVFMFSGAQTANAAPAAGAAAQKAMSSHEYMATLPAGVTAKDLNSDHAIEKTFKGITEYAVDTTGFDNVVSYLVAQDHERVKKSTDKSLSNLDGNKDKAFTNAVDSLSASWKTKYNEKFSINYKDVYAGGVLHIQTGEVSDPSLLVGKWPVDANSGTLTTAGANTVEKKSTFGGEVKLEKGREVAVARLDRMNGMPGVTASLIHEHGSGWHFDIPNTIDAQHLYDNLVANLSYINAHQADWPKDKNQASCMVTHGVILALYDVNLQKMPMGKTAMR